MAERTNRLELLKEARRSMPRQEYNDFVEEVSKEAFAKLSYDDYCIISELVLKLKNMGADTSAILVAVAAIGDYVNNPTDYGA